MKSGKQVICLLKWMGAILLLAACVTAGFAESRKLSVRVERLEGFLKFLSAAEAEIRYTASPVERILARQGGGLDFQPGCLRAMEQGMNFQQAWEACAGMGWNKTDAALLRDFGQGFGATDLEGQLAHCGLYERLAGERLEEARRERDVKSKLYRTLGVSGGIAAVLLFL